MGCAMLPLYMHKFVRIYIESDDARRSFKMEDIALGHFIISTAGL